jgi:hypothetical protein
MINMFATGIKNTNMLIWISILLYLDSGLALLSQNRIEKVLPRWNINVIAIIEAVTATILAGIHFYTGR